MVFEGGKWEFWALLLGKVVVDFGMGGILSWCVDELATGGS